MSLFRWLERKGQFTASPSGERGYSSANTEVQKVEAQHHRKRGACYVCYYQFSVNCQSLKLIFTNISVTPKTLNIFSANISRFIVPLLDYLNVVTNSKDYRTVVELRNVIISLILHCLPFLLHQGKKSLTRWQSKAYIVIALGLCSTHGSMCDIIYTPGSSSFSCVRCIYQGAWEWG